MQHRAVLGHVDLLAAEHRVAAAGQVRLVGQLPQQSAAFLGNAILGIVQMQSDRVDRESFGAARIVGEQLPQVRVFDFVS